MAAKRVRDTLNAPLKSSLAILKKRWKSTWKTWSRSRQCLKSIHILLAVKVSSLVLYTILSLWCIIISLYIFSWICWCVIGFQLLLCPKVSKGNVWDQNSWSIRSFSSMVEAFGEVYKGQTSIRWWMINRCNKDPPLLTNALSRANLICLTLFLGGNLSPLTCAVVILRPFLKMKPIIFYDLKLEGLGDDFWSPNPNKTRFALNIKVCWHIVCEKLNSSWIMYPGPALRDSLLELLWYPFQDSRDHVA